VIEGDAMEEHAEDVLQAMREIPGTVRTRLLY